jgi:hypothetical protein
VRITIIILAIFLIIQFFQPDRTNPPATAEIRAPLAVMKILNKSCYDCHSNLTNWPLYSKISPISWLIASNVNNGRSKLNFSEWRKYSGKIQKKLQKEIWEQVSEDGMPILYYTWMHPSAIVTLSEKQILKKWVIGK